MRQQEKIELLQPFVASIYANDTQYAALMYGLVIQIKSHPIWGPIWRQQHKMSEPDIFNRLRPDPVFGGIVRGLDDAAKRKVELYDEALKAIGSPKGPKALKAVELIESLLQERAWENPMPSPDSRTRH